VIDVIDVAPLLHAVENRYDLFAMTVARQSFENSPHADTMTVFVRGPLGWTRDWYQHDIGAMDYPAAQILAEPLREVVAPVIRRLQIAQLGRVMIVELPPGGRIARHVDQGEYARHYQRWHLVLSGGPRATLTCDGNVVQCLPGRLFWFNHHLPHEAANDEAHARLAVIIDGVVRA
jgi:quercetin dioxygenase-like cupin family protein